MAYTEALDPTVPADGDLLSEGDDSIRQLKRALIERLLTLVEDVDANPLVLKPVLPSTGSVKFLQSDFHTTAPVDLQRGPISVGPNTTTLAVVSKSFVIPTGWTITDVKFHVYSSHAAGLITCYVYRQQHEAALADILATEAAVADAGWQTLTAAVNVDAVDDDIFAVTANLDASGATVGGNTQLGWVEVSLTRA